MSDRPEREVEGLARRLEHEKFGPSREETATEMMLLDRIRTLTAERDRLEIEVKRLRSQIRRNHRVPGLESGSAK